MARRKQPTLTPMEQFWALTRGFTNIELENEDGEYMTDGQLSSLIAAVKHCKPFYGKDENYFPVCIECAGGPESYLFINWVDDRCRCRECFATIPMVY